MPSAEQGPRKILFNLNFTEAEKEKQMMAVLWKQWGKKEKKTFPEEESTHQHQLLFLTQVRKGLKSRLIDKDRSLVTWKE